MGFESGSDHGLGSYSNSHVRLVRGGQSFAFLLRLQQTSNGTISSSNSAFFAGATANLTATPNRGYVLSGWSPAPCAASFTMPANGLTCTATFTKSIKAHFSLTPSTGAPPLTVRLDASEASDLDGYITGYRWAVERRTLAGMISGHTFTQTGDYTVSLTVTDNEGFTDTQQHNIRVSLPLKAQFSMTPAQGSAPLSVALDASASTGLNMASYAWRSSDGQQARGQQAILTLTQGGTQTITLTVTDDQGATHSVQRSVVVDSHTPPNAVFSLSAKSLYEDGESKRKCAILRQVFRFFKANSGLFNEKKRKTGPKGRVCSRLSRFRIGSNSGAAPLTVSADASASSDSDGSVVRYVWQSSHGQTANGPKPTFNFTAPGSYTLTLAVTDDGGASRNTSQIIQVHSSNAGDGHCIAIVPVVKNFGAVVPNKSSFPESFNLLNTCQTDTQVKSISIGGTHPGQFELLSNDCSGTRLAYQKSCAVSMAFNPSSLGDKQARLTVMSGANNHLLETPLTGRGAVAPPTACITRIATNSLSATPDVRCSSDSDGSIVRYDWAISSAVGPTEHCLECSLNHTFHFSAPGIYTATLTITDNDGNSTHTSQTFELSYGSLRLSNISVRCHVQPNPKTAIVGFVIEGTGTKKVLLRGLAVPSMSPGLDLHISLNRFINNTWQEILSNDNWMQSSRANKMTALPSHLVPRSSNDAALLVDLKPGVYTLIAAPQGASGIGVVSADDLDEMNPSSRLVNISGRCSVEDGNGNAIAGFVIEGDGSLQTLLRGMRTASMDLSGSLNPRLELMQIYPGNPVADALDNRLVRV